MKSTYQSANLLDRSVAMLQTQANQPLNKQTVRGVTNLSCQLRCLSSCRNVLPGEERLFRKDAFLSKLSVRHVPQKGTNTMNVSHIFDSLDPKTKSRYMSVCLRHISIFFHVSIHTKNNAYTTTITHANASVL